MEYSSLALRRLGVTLDGFSTILYESFHSVLPQPLFSLLSPSANSLQAAVFLNRKPQAEWLAARLSSEGFPSAYLSGGDRPQEERMKAMEAVRGFKLRVRRREWLAILWFG